jgi:hypothetical protein
MVKRLLFLLCFAGLLSQPLAAQVSVKDSVVFAPLVAISYGGQIPGGDLSSRFGINSSLGTDLLFKTRKNFLYGVDWRFMFGNQLKEKGILDSIATSASFIISTDGYPAVIKLFERGYSVMGRFGKIFPVWPNQNSGIMITTGLGFLQHKIRIEDISEKAPQISKEYKKGYDRLSNGPAAMLSAGYMYLGNRKYINVFGMAEMYYAMTKNRRGYNYDLMAPDTKTRTDLLYGLRFGVIIPFYQKVPDQFYYN